MNILATSGERHSAMKISETIPFLQINGSTYTKHKKLPRMEPILNPLLAEPKYCLVTE
jgi:hypothetical protein